MRGLGFVPMLRVYRSWLHGAPGYDRGVWEVGVARTKSQAKRFRAVLEKGNRALGWTIARVPFDPAKEWKQMLRLRVRGEVNGFAFRTSLFPEARGGFYLLVNRAMQASAGV